MLHSPPQPRQQQPPPQRQAFSGIISNQAIDNALVVNLDQEGLLRLKSVEIAVYFFMSKSPTESMLHDAYNRIYKFLKTGETEKPRTIE